MTVLEVFRDGRAGDFHAREWPTDHEPHIWWFHPVRAALVLGSTQTLDSVDIDACTERGIDIVQRRSGGGAVLLQPGGTVWIDVVLPSGHPRWRLDIGESAVWIGDVCATTLTRMGCGPMEIHTGAMQRSSWSSLVCFAGRGAGEVFDSQGSKVVGISQRRTRQWARFQCVISMAWDPDTLVQILRPPRPNLSEIATAGSTLTRISGTTRTPSASSETLDGEVIGGAVVDSLRAALDSSRDLQ